MVNFTTVSSTHACTQNVEFSVAKNTNFNSGSPVTTTGYATVWLDLTALAAGDTLEIRVYRAIAGGTLTADDVATVQTAQIWTRTLGLVQGNWDVTIKITSATGRTIGFEVTIDTNDVSLVANSVNASSLGADAVAEIVTAVWDELLTGATHNINNSAGKRLRQLNAVAIRTDTAQGSGNGVNQIQLDVAASSVDGIYDKNLIVLTAGPGAGQSRIILRYEGATKIATVERDWRAGQVPTNATDFQIFGAAYLDSISEGLAAAGGSNTITLDPGSPSIDDCLNDNTITLCSGAGEGQSRRIVGYNGTTHVATVFPAWTVQPTNTTGYVVLPDAEMNPSELAPLQADLDDIQTRLPVALIGGNMPAAVQTIAASAITAAATAGDFLSAVAGQVMSSAIGTAKDFSGNPIAVTLLGVMRITLAELAGKLSGLTGLTPGAPVWRDPSDTKDVVRGAITATGRSQVLVDPT